MNGILRHIKLLCLLPLVLLGAGCDTNGVAQADLDFAFQYKLYLGLDCFMIQNCGYEIRVTETGTLQFYEDTGQLRLTRQEPFSAAEAEALEQLLAEHNFFAIDYDFTEDEGHIGFGAVTLTYTDFTNQTTKQIEIPTEGSVIPENVQALLDAVEQFFAGKIEF